MPDSTDRGSGLSNDSLLDLVYRKGLSAAQWREIGTRLKVESGKLDEIEWDHSRSSTECLLKMLNVWRKQYGDKATMKKYTRALR